MKSIYLTLITFAFMIFAVESSAQTCAYPEGRIAESPVFVYDANADLMRITVPVKNVGGNGFVSPFKITVYKDDIGNANRYTYNYNGTIAAGETVNITFDIPDFKADRTPFDNIKIRINDGGNGYSDQLMCDSAYRDYTRTQLIASDDYMLVFNNSTNNQFRVAINDILPSSYVSLTVNLLTDPVYTGTTTVGGSTIFYTPAANTSADTLRYRIHCGNAQYADTATVYIKIIDKPENIGDAECFVEPEATTWSMKEIPINKSHAVYNYAPFAVGDIDNDGKVEILGYSDAKIGGGIFGSRGINIFTVENNSVIQKNSFDLTSTCPSGFSTFGSMAIARYNNTGYIVIMGQDYYIYAFNPTGGFLWKSDATVIRSTTSALDCSSLLNIADFNGDGIPEVYTGNQIFSLDGGELLCSGGSSNNKGLLNPINYGQYYTVAVDMDNDGKLELCAGTQIYKVNIPAGGKTSSGCSMNVITGMEFPTASLPSGSAKDGATQVADIDNDGIPEIIVISVSGSYTTVYVWKPLPGNQSYLMGYYTIGTNNLYSVPMIGNIDTDKYLEIVFITVSYIYALDFDPTKPVGNQIILKWTRDHTDMSFCTGMSLFDFNLDGMNEIVYRDETQLRIINGNHSGGGMLPKENILTTVPNVSSGTLREFPVIADVDNDGQAEIIVSGHDITVWADIGYVRVFKTDGSPWAPARKVWNQYAYNSVNVNDDLTIPTVQMNPATVFPGPDGQLGTSDDIRPYNNYMQQQTILSKNGTPYWEASDYAIEGIPNTYYYETADSLVISFCVKNYGDVQGTAPFHVTIYKNSRHSGNVVVTKSFPNIPAPGQTSVCYSIKVEKVNEIDDLSSLHLWLNDSGGGTNVNPECDYTNGVVIYDVSGNISAEDDYASVFACDAVAIPILANDEYAGTTFAILNPPKYGSAVQSGGGLTYMSDGGTSGLSCALTGNRTDTVRYKIESIIASSLQSEAYAIIKIYSPPEMILENACSPNPKIALSNGYEGFTYDWEYSQDGASGWTLVSTGGGSMELNIVNTTAGFYRLTINYEGGKKYQLKKGVEVVTNRTTQLRGGIVWYDLSSNSVNINWQ